MCKFTQNSVQGFEEPGYQPKANRVRLLGFQQSCLLSFFHSVMALSPVHLKVSCCLK